VCSLSGNPFVYGIFVRYVCDACRSINIYHTITAHTNSLPDDEPEVLNL
jgi:hypothetical protein